MASHSTAGAFHYCLNTSTIKGQKLSLLDELKLTAEAGYDGIEPWVRELDAYAEAGGSLEDFGKRAADLGLAVENLIGFFEWVVDDGARRSKALEEARRNMDIARRVGCTRLAAPPFGATDVADLNLNAAAERFRAVLDLGEQFGVTPMLEFWGHSKALQKLGEALHVAAQCGRRDACILADVFHMFKGGSPYEGLRLVGADTIALFHVNDFPARPPRAEITDAARVYPGDGVAPLHVIFRDLHRAGFHGPLSLELFNESYWAQPARAVAETGLRKMRAAVEHALKG
jgi:2-keto-myo-inositol isomerase